jgi:hypothetical protein
MTDLIDDQFESGPELLPRLTLLIPEDDELKIRLRNALAFASPVKLVQKISCVKLKESLK